jgi:hypothetical protein
MPITFAVDHARGLVVVIVNGVVTREIVDRYFENQQKLGGLNYPRIVECRDIQPQITSPEWQSITTRLRGVTQGLRVGPAAVIVDNEQTCALVDMIAILVSDFCELQPFVDRDSAEEWLGARRTGAPLSRPRTPREI